MRVFAGPNGSGKSAIFEQIDNKFDVGFYINADKIEKEIISKDINLEDFGLQEIDETNFNNFLQSHTFLLKSKAEGIKLNIHFENNHLSIPDKSSVNSYQAALIADFLRHSLIKHGKKFAFETVMSHKSKIEILDHARKNGYKNYLYFICTESPQINIERVKQRVQQGGHPVPEDKIEERYYRTLSLLKPAVQKTYRTFIWDNSALEPKLILEVETGKKVTFHAKEIPFWVDKYLLKI